MKMFLNTWINMLEKQNKIAFAERNRSGHGINIWILLTMGTTTLSMKSTADWDVMPCSLPRAYKCFGGMYCTHLQGWRVRQVKSKQSLVTFLIFLFFTSTCTYHIYSLKPLTLVLQPCVLGTFWFIRERIVIAMWCTLCSHTDCSKYKQDCYQVPRKPKLGYFTSVLCNIRLLHRVTVSVLFYYFPCQYSSCK